jgi:dihydroorotate dehydrogenase (NAD+) catalytic subunit
MIELAPNHKSGLALANPVMPAAGCFGFGAEYARLVETEALGAVVVGPVTAGPRRGSKPPRVVAVPGGLLLHTGLANPGIASVVRRYRRVWARSPVPVILHVAGTSAQETASCCRRISGAEEIAAIEVGLADSVDIHTACDIIEAARVTLSQPMIVRLPLTTAESFCEAAIKAGADALTIAAPPRGTALLRITSESDSNSPQLAEGKSSKRFITGRLYGRFALPLAIRALRRVAELVSVPLIGCGGIHGVEDGRAFLQAGATAIQIGGALWRDPACLARIARGLTLKP